MKGNSLSLTEKLILLLVFVVLVFGFVFFLTDPALFEQYVVEDGIVEWLTVLGLLLGAFVCFSRFISLLKNRNWWFLLVTIVLGLILFFGAGEEVSWGQRMLGIKSSEFFAKNNAQGETNLHNLVVDGVKLNKLIFSLILGIAMGIYLLAVPFLYHKNHRVRNLLNMSGIPVPRLYQIISFTLLAIITSLLQHGKNAELLECGTTLLFFLIIRYPQNAPVFKNSPLETSR